VSVAARVRTQLAKRAPRLEETAVRANWRLRNRSRSFSPDGLDPKLRGFVDALARDGVVTGRFDDLVGDRALFDEAAARAQRLYEAPRDEAAAESGSKATYLTKLATGKYSADDPFVRIALHPNVLAVANGYLRMRSHLRALELWLTKPTPGAAVQTQLWHRDADDVMNVKLFVYFTNVTRPAGPLTYAPRTHPLGDRRDVPEHDEHRRSTDEQMARIVPESEWRVLEGEPGTIVLADTCGYHKQLKPESDERVKLVCHYVSGTPYVAPAIEISGIDAGTLTDDQYYAVFDRARG
jgi:Phytanoyl-CoA dioxygenase (PhyH)